MTTVPFFSVTISKLPLMCTLQPNHTSNRASQRSDSTRVISVQKALTYLQCLLQNAPIGEFVSQASKLQRAKGRVTLCPLGAPRRRFHLSYTSKNVVPRVAGPTLTIPT